MGIHRVSQQHFYLYLISIGIVAVFDLYNSIVRLKPEKNKNHNEKYSKSKDKGTLTLLYLAKFLPNISTILIYYFFSNTHYSSLLSLNLSGLLGILTFISGFLIRQIAIIQLGKFYTYKVSISEDHEVIDTGLYAYVRHPAYIGTFLELTGSALFYNHLILSWFISIPYFIVVLKRIRHEEKTLIDEFGMKYEKYMQRSGMFLPKIF